MKMWQYGRYVLLAVFVLIFVLFFIRLVLPSQLDDVSPGISCDENLLDRADVYYVIPKFDGVAINKEWCDLVLGRDRELAMHGVTHEYREFGEVRNVAYFQEGVDIFQNCFGFTPERFKPGNLGWNSGNDWIRDEVEVDILWNQLFHKVYHCNDTGKFPNWLIRVF